jgi:hypothetical protein
MNTRADTRALKEVFTIGGTLLCDGAESIGADKPATLRFALLAKCLSDAPKQLTDAYARADPSVLAGIASGASLVSQALDRLDNLSHGHDRTIDLYDLLGGLEVISDAILDAARSISLPGPLDDSVSEKARATLDQFAPFRMDAALLAQRFDSTASILRQVVNLPLRNDFVFPGGTSCCSVAAPSPDFRDSGGTAQLQTQLVDPAREANLAIADVDGLADDLGAFLTRSGLFFKAFPVALLLFCCNDVCTTPNTASACAVTRTYAVNRSGFFIPMFDLAWTMCCTSTCCVFFSQNRTCTVPSSHAVGGVGAIPATRPIGTATGVSAAVAPVVAAAVNAALAAGTPVPASPAAILPRKTAVAVPACVPC